MTIDIDSVHLFGLDEETQLSILETMEEAVTSGAGKLDSFEYGFALDFSNRYKKFGRSLMLSPKQRLVITDIARKLSQDS